MTLAIQLLFLTGMTIADLDIIRKDSNVVVEVMGTVKLIRGSWSIVLHLDKPEFPDFEPWLSLLERAIQAKMTDSQFFDFPDWSDRI